MFTQDNDEFTSEFLYEDLSPLSLSPFPDVAPTTTAASPSKFEIKIDHTTLVEINQSPSAASLPLTSTQSSLHSQITPHPTQQYLLQDQPNHHLPPNLTTSQLQSYLAQEQLNQRAQAQMKLQLDHSMTLGIEDKLQIAIDQNLRQQHLEPSYYPQFQTHSPISKSFSIPDKTQRSSFSYPAAAAQTIPYSFPTAAQHYTNSLQSQFDDSASQMSYQYTGQQSLATDDKRKKRRESHNLVERRRRDTINEKISELSLLLPDLVQEIDSGMKPQKGIILRRTVDYIVHAQGLMVRGNERIAELEGVVRGLMRETGRQECELGLVVPLGTIIANTDILVPNRGVRRFMVNDTVAAMGMGVVGIYVDEDQDDD